MVLLGVLKSEYLTDAEGKLFGMPRGTYKKYYKNMQKKKKKKKRRRRRR